MYIFKTISIVTPLEGSMVAYSNILAWEIPWTEESGRLPSMEPQTV